MSVFFIILIVVLVCWPWISRFISRLAQEFMARRAEDMMRRMMGMPSRKEERKRNRNRNSERRRGSDTDESYSAGGKQAGGRRHGRPSYSVAALLRSVAVDVEYVEIREFGNSFMDGDGGVRFVYEEQVSDVEYTEIRSSR